ncbi:MAG: ATP-dependent DNA helicase RecG [Lachnospiraceae bacterium]|nr:ATP-dependent DNA helicase RecG [Lachnospiraceae bacterium]
MSGSENDIRNIKGVGEKTAALFNKLGIFSFTDLLYYFPRDYIKYGDTVPVGGDVLGQVIAFEAMVVKQPLLKRAGRLTVTSCALKAGDEVISAVWFNMPYISKSLKLRSIHVFYGRVCKNGARLSIEQPVIFTHDQFDEIKNSLQPVYSLTKGLSNGTVKKSVKSLLNMIPEDSEYDFRSMHFPKSFEELKKARERFVYDEFFFYILRLRFLKEQNLRAVNSFNIIQSAEAQRIIDALPYRLTNAQLKVWKEIENDLLKKSSMNRLVQGDVGSGKTIISFLAAITVAASRCQCAIMAPTEILAAQHFEALTELIKKHGFDIPCILLTGSVPVSQKKKLYREAEEGKALIIIGTHALIQEKVSYNNLALVITDEQHRFGVAQREALFKKNSADTPHVLVMSATPIPRTLALILYGDLDVSVIDEVPAKRLPIKNCVVDESYHEKAFKFMEKQIAQGRQCYVICPLVEQSESLDMKDAVGFADVLRSRFPEGINIGLMHGKLKSSQKAAVMDAFYRNDIQILVSTTVVEVGVNVPNATVMVIENAERFGLAQLHQLRGRIGRGDKQSYCIFFNGNDNEDNRERLEILVKSNDGFEIAAKDLEIRGQGDLFGIRQSGELVFKMADIFSDAEILKKASEDVTALLESDPALSRPENAPIKEKLDRIEKTGSTVL